MATKSITKTKSFDWVTLTVYFSLVTIGWFMIFSTLYNESTPYETFDLTSPMGAQTLWTIISVFAFLSVLTIDWKFWNTLAFPIYGITLLLLILVLIFGKEINGAKAWFSFGFFSIQPSEWAKFGTTLAISSYLSFFKTSTSSLQTIFVSGGLFIIPALLVLLQPDFGSSIVFFSFIILLYRRGLTVMIPLIILALSLIFVFSLMYNPFLVTAFLLLLISAILLFDQMPPTQAGSISLGILLIMIFMLFQGEKEISLLIPSGIVAIVMGFIVFKKKNFRLFNATFIALIVGLVFAFGSSYLFDNVVKPHQQERINVWLRPDRCDPQGSLYNIIQSKLAIGSGGFFGKGFLKGQMTKLNYVPEQSTDFIFTSIGEEQGFIGTLSVIFLYAILLIRCVIIAERANLEFIRNYSYGVCGILFVHFFFNIGMTMNLLPVVGIPLPLLSKGGSSLTAFSIMIAVMLKMDMARYRAN
jgi:rod shape determining protein RodA